MFFPGFLTYFSEVLKVFGGSFRVLLGFFEGLPVLKVALFPMVSGWGALAEASELALLGDPEEKPPKNRPL